MVPLRSGHQNLVFARLLLEDSRRLASGGLNFLELGYLLLVIGYLDRIRGLITFNKSLLTPQLRCGTMLFEIRVKCLI